jgi:hypothetical protein
MNAAQLEALVLEAIDRLRLGAGGEDDHVEFKRDWPDPTKARQLAGAANRASGDFLIYVIGVDDKDGSVHPLSMIDPATWWSQVESGFDEVAPELIRHLNIQVSLNEAVVALEFGTDRAPYVVKLLNGGQTEREVPIRVGTRTRSAHRHELLKLLYPVAQIPRLLAMSAELSVRPPGYLGGNADRVIQIRLSTHVYFEHVHASTVFLPRHDSGVIFAGDSLREHGEIEYEFRRDTRS